MTTRYFDEPVVVDYRGAGGWQRALALAVRRANGNTYDVLITHADRDGAEHTAWVPRSRIRAADATACRSASSGLARPMIVEVAVTPG